MSVPVGQGAGFHVLVPGAMLVLLPVCFTHGALFTLGCSIYSDLRRNHRVSSADTPAKAYILEGLGTLAGAALVTFILIPLFSSFSITIAVSALNFLTCIMLFILLIPEKSGTILSYFSVILLAVTVIVLLSPLGEKIHRQSISAQWGGEEVVHYHNSIYDNITVTSQNGQYTIYTGGMPHITLPYPDIESIEERAHFPLLSHGDAKDILILGGGAGGIINEVLKYPGTYIDYLELDPELGPSEKVFF